MVWQFLQIVSSWWLALNVKLYCLWKIWKKKNLIDGYTFKGDNSVKMILLLVWKGVYSKRKEFAPLGSEFFPFRADPLYSLLLFGKQIGSHKSCLPCNKWSKIIKVYPVPEIFYWACKMLTTSFYCRHCLSLLRTKRIRADLKLKKWNLKISHWLTEVCAVWNTREINSTRKACGKAAVYMICRRMIKKSVTWKILDSWVGQEIDLIAQMEPLCQIVQGYWRDIRTLMPHCHVISHGSRQLHLNLCRAWTNKILHRQALCHLSLHSREHLPQIMLQDEGHWTIKLWLINQEMRVKEPGCIEKGLQVWKRSPPILLSQRSHQMLAVQMWIDCWIDQNLLLLYNKVLILGRVKMKQMNLR